MVEFVVSRLPKVECPLLRDILVDEIFLEAFAMRLDGDENLHLAEYGTVISIAAHNYDHYRARPVWEV